MVCINRVSVGSLFYLSQKVSPRPESLIKQYILHTFFVLQTAVKEISGTKFFTMNEKKSLLMNDSSRTDKGKEAVFDQILSWTLRRAQIAYSDDDAILYKYCRMILFRILGINDYSDCDVFTHVGIEREWENIDVIATVTLQRTDGSKENHVILIENKVYAPLGKNQLETYRPVFDKRFANGNICHYVVITCLEEPTEEMQASCDENGFRCIPILDLCPNDLRPDTESDIFNEFWLREW